ncbi:MAG TPA: hypothetical protein DEA32_00960 [Firmicutes bacterium]|nr:hypothetical protein [Bacillota bacterium]
MEVREVILATDLDGTLLYPRKPIGVLAERNRNFLRRLHAQGHAIVAVSGRNSKILPDLNKDLGFAVPFIGCNGGFIIGEDGKLIEKRPIDKDVVLELYASMIDRCGIGAWLVMDETEQDYFDVHNLSSFATVLAVIGNFFSFKYGEKFSLNRKEFLHRLSRGNICKLEALTGIGIGK